jgi:hypothetical protein
MSVAPVASLAETEQWKLGGGTPGGGKRKKSTGDGDDDKDKGANKKKVTKEQAETAK